MKIASFDIGIKNMAYCIFDISPDNWSAIDWNVVDLMDSSSTTNSISHQNTVCGCTTSQKKQPKSKGKTPKSAKESTKESVNKQCKNKAKYYKDHTTAPTEYFCEKHAKAQTQYLLPSKEYTLAHLRKQKVNDISELYRRLIIGESVGLLPITYEDKSSPDIPRTPTLLRRSGVLPNKPEMIDAIFNYYNSRLFSEIPVAKKNANDANLIQIGWAIRRIFESCPHFSGITHVVIENQISPIATRMKTIQGMLAQYFIMKSTLEHPVEIVFISSSNKLRLDKSTTKPSTPETNTTEKSGSNPNYKQHKKDGVSLCSRFIEANPALSKWSGTMKVAKKDDLADCFLQGVWFMSNRNIITCAENLKINIV
jgi:hypothetical protein